MNLNHYRDNRGLSSDSRGNPFSVTTGPVFSARAKVVVVLGLLMIAAGVAWLISEFR